MTYKILQTNFERELLLQIISNMRLKKLSYEKAKKISQAFLPVLKSENPQEFIEKLSYLSRYYPEIMEAFIVTVKDYEKEEVDSRLVTIRTIFEGGEIYGK